MDYSIRHNFFCDSEFHAYMIIRQTYIYLYIYIERERESKDTRQRSAGATLSFTLVGDLQATNSSNLL